MTFATARWGIAGLLLMAALPGMCAPSAAIAQTAASRAVTRVAPDDTVQYRVRRGDTLIGLGQRHLLRAQDYRIIQRINGVANPFRLQQGRTLNIPIDLLRFRPATGSVLSWRGDVQITSVAGRSTAPTAAMALAEGLRITTGEGSSLAMRLEDGSVVTIPSNSSVRLARLRHIALTDSIDYEIAVDRGRINSRVAPLRNTQGRFRSRTPVSTSAVRGTDFNTGFDDARNIGLTELAEGGVAVATPAGSSAALDPGFGAAAAASGLAVEPLLPAPPLASGSDTQRDATLRFAVTPSPSERGYRLVVARDSSFTDMVAEQRSTAPNITVGGLDDGRYFARIAAIAPSGLEGMPRNFAFRRRLNSTNASAARGDDGYRFSWLSSGTGVAHYRFQLFRAERRGAAAVPISAPLVDEPALAERGITISDLPPGLYVWRVATDLADGTDSDRSWTGFQDVTVGE